MMRKRSRSHPDFLRTGDPEEIGVWREERGLRQNRTLGQSNQSRAYFPRARPGACPGAPDRTPLAALFPCKLNHSDQLKLPIKELRTISTRTQDIEGYLEI